MSALDILRDLERRDIHIRPQGDQICMDGPVGELTDEVVAVVRSRKPAILARLRVHHYLLDDGDGWRTMLAVPGASLDEVRASLFDRFGGEHVLDVRPAWREIEQAPGLSGTTGPTFS